jgi:hypothetical protein
MPVAQHRVSTPSPAPKTANRFIRIRQSASSKEYQQGRGLIRLEARSGPVRRSVSGVPAAMLRRHLPRPSGRQRQPSDKAEAKTHIGVYLPSPVETRPVSEASKLTAAMGTSHEEVVVRELAVVLGLLTVLPIPIHDPRR